MVVHFNSGDGKIDHGIKCLPTETFAEVEEKLYKIYDEYRETNTVFSIIICFLCLKIGGFNNYMKYKF